MAVERLLYWLLSSYSTKNNGVVLNHSPHGNEYFIIAWFGPEMQAKTGVNSKEIGVFGGMGPHYAINGIK
jgi:hypothetical protein